jgi:hypothetical protein
MATSSVMARGIVCAAAALITMAAGAVDVRAQSLDDALSFLLTNRSIPTGDFAGDRAAAEATRDTIARLLHVEISTVPAAASASGFTYRLNPSLGIVERSSQSFGPFLVNRSLTLGRRQVAVSMAYRETSFSAIDGRPLRDGTLVATASRLAADSMPFDVETLALHVQMRSTVISANVGLTDRWDVALTVPFVTVSLNGDRVDTYRGQRFLQASASATASGVSDLIVRSKYNVIRHGRSGLAAGAEIRLPTGAAANLLGAGQAAFAPRLIGSIELDRIAVHADAASLMGGVTNEIDFGGALTVVATPRVTLVGELSGRRLASIGRLEDAVEPHPALSGVETLRLTSSTRPAHRLTAAAGFKWNVMSSWVLSGYLSRPLTSSGFATGWRPTLMLDYLLAR